MTKPNIGNDIQAIQMGGGVAGTSGTATGTGAASMTDSGATWTTNAYTGHQVVLGGLHALVLSNTGTVLTLDQWYTPGASDTAASTPSTGTYVILPGGAPARYMALSTDTSTPATGDTTLPSEITTSGGGLIAKRCTYAHTVSASTYSLTGVFTGNGSDSYSVSIAKAGIRQSIKAACSCLFHTLFPSVATLNVSGDQVTVTDTIAM